jgi:type IV pilus assembly protein PilP
MMRLARRYPRVASLPSFFLAASALVAVLPSCGGSPVATVTGRDSGVAPPPLRGAALAAAAAPSSSAALPPPAVFHEDDFAESERSRDPFRSYAGLFSEQGKTRVRSQRQVLLDQFAIDDLKLIGLVTRADLPRAMLVDPSGRGWVVTKGQFVGRAEIVHAGGPGGVDYELNWKVDRIREGDLVLVREDPAHPEVPPATRVIALRGPETIGTQSTP